MVSWEQLAALREVPNLAGGLHELQVTQLKMWAFVAAPHLRRHEFDWDVEGKTINYRFWFSKRKAPADFKKRLEALDRSIKSMLGEDWTVHVTAQKKRIYDSPARGEHWKKLEAGSLESSPLGAPQPLEPAYRPKTRMVEKNGKVLRGR